MLLISVTLFLHTDFKRDGNGLGAFDAKQMKHIELDFNRDINRIECTKCSDAY